MMPAPYDPKLAIARLQTDSTGALRSRYPHLCWVWDELDELRVTIGELTEQVEKLDEGVRGAVEEYEEADEPDVKDLISSLKELTNDA